jgi:MinD-like ATPase involved in chromosome partitioning or flagellar assembly
MVILNDIRGDNDRDAELYLTEKFSQSGATVEYMPNDPHLAAGGIIDIQTELRKSSRLRLFEIAAALADKYVPEADRSR